MTSVHLLTAFLDSLKAPFVFVDTEHVIRWMNAPARLHYREGADLVGSSIMACHSPRSQAMMLEIFAEMERGLDERLITDNARWRIYMRAVRDADGRLLGYFERYEPPVLAAGLDPAQ